MTLPDPVTDPAGYVLAVAELREQRANAATGGGAWQLEESDGAHTIVLASSGSHESQYTEIKYTHDLYTEDSDQYETACLIAEHIAGEANPEHALKEVALWRSIAERHRLNSHHFALLDADVICCYCGISEDDWPCPDLLAVVAAAKAYDQTKELD